MYVSSCRDGVGAGKNDSIYCLNVDVVGKIITWLLLSFPSCLLCEEIFYGCYRRTPTQANDSL